MPAQAEATRVLHRHLRWHTGFESSDSLDSRLSYFFPFGSTREGFHGIPHWPSVVEIFNFHWQGWERGGLSGLQCLMFSLSPTWLHFFFFFWLLKIYFPVKIPSLSCKTKWWDQTVTPPLLPLSLYSPLSFSPWMATLGDESPSIRNGECGGEKALCIPSFPWCMENNLIPSRSRAGAGRWGVRRAKKPNPSPPTLPKMAVLG